MLIMQIAQHMQVSIRQFLTAGDPYSTFPQKKLTVLDTSGFTVGTLRLASRLILCYRAMLDWHVLG